MGASVVTALRHTHPRRQSDVRQAEHAEVRIGDSAVMMFDARPEWPPTPGSILRL